ncbi:MAG: COX15/CtaA family protein [Gemmatimonadota bacterium]|jgi:cytochrome c oxidase assembly protein subunit 15
MSPVQLRRYTKFVAAATFTLLLAGGMVTSTGSGLSVPDWPLSFGRVMPPMRGGVLYEHGHRMVATFVGLLIVIEAVWLWRSEPRRWVRRLGAIALVGVVVQGLLGGLTVLLRLPDLVSIGHAVLAELVFAITLVIAVACSVGWQRARTEDRTINRSVGLLASITAGIVLVQIALGAAVRHTGAGLAIPDFPLAYGELVPPLNSGPVALHFAHRVGALVVTAAVGLTALRVFRPGPVAPGLARPMIVMLALVCVQIALGGWTVLSFKAAGVATAHLGVGALLWGTAVVLAMRAARA